MLWPRKLFLCQDSEIHMDFREISEDQEKNSDHQYLIHYNAILYNCGFYVKAIQK